MLHLKDEIFGKKKQLEFCMECDLFGVGKVRDFLLSSIAYFFLEVFNSTRKPKKSVYGT